MILTHVDLIDKLLKYVPGKEQAEWRKKFAEEQRKRIAKGQALSRSGANAKS
jgi:hypothetical protein